MDIVFVEAKNYVDYISLFHTIIDKKLYRSNGSSLRCNCLFHLDNSYKKQLYTFNHKYTWKCNQIKHSRNYIILVLAYVNNEPVGVLYIQFNEIMFYVKPVFRRKGIATRLFEYISENHYVDKLYNWGYSIPAIKLKSKFNIKG